VDLSRSSIIIWQTGSDVNWRIREIEEENSEMIKKGKEQRNENHRTRTVHTCSILKKKNLFNLCEISENIRHKLKAFVITILYNGYKFKTELITSNLLHCKT